MTRLKSPRTWRAPSLSQAALACAIVLAGCAAPPIEQGRQQIEQGNVKEGLATLEASMKARPLDTEPRIAYFRARDQVLNRLLGQATTVAAGGNLEEATRLYREVLSIDPKQARAIDGLALVDAARRHQIMAEEAQRRFDQKDLIGTELAVRSILQENASHPGARELDRQLREIEARAATTVPLLKSKLQAPVNLEFREAPLRLVVEALSRSAGINFIMDREVRPDLKATIFVRNVRVEDAIDLILQNNQLERKVLTENTILIYPKTAQKQREHQELLIRTFQIGNADAKQTLNLLRTLLKTRDVYVDERSNLLIMRDTPDAIRAAEKLIAAQDAAEPEVVLELEILEVSRSKVRDIGIGYPSEFSGPSGTLATIGRIGDARNIASDTGFKLKLLRTDGETKTLANPRVRVRNREKARVHVGDRVPVISSSVVGTSTGQAGATPVTTEQIQYLDVGIKIEAEPTIYPDNTVAVKINLDVSSLGNQTRTNAGTTAYEVGTRNAQTVLRLNNGETQALMGLIRDDDVITGAGLPGLGEAPGLDMVFGTKKTDRRSRELVLLITPQLVRPATRPAPEVAEFWSGTDGSVRMGSPFVRTLPEKIPAVAPAATPGTTPGAAVRQPAAAAAEPPLALPQADGAAGAAPAGPNGSDPSAPTPATPAGAPAANPAALPAATDSAAAGAPAAAPLPGARRAGFAPVVGSPAEAAATAAANAPIVPAVPGTAPTLGNSVAAAAAPTPLVPMALNWNAPASVKAGQEFDVQVLARSAGALKGASVQMRYDPERIEILAVDDGGYFSRAGGKPVFSKRIDAGLGIVFATINATANATATGAAPLVTLRARAKGKTAGTATLQMGAVVGVDDRNRQVPIQSAGAFQLGIAP